MSTRPAFLFDLDGTLADTLGDIAASTNHVRERHGLPAVDLATVRTYVGDGARKLLARALADVLAELPATAIDARLDAAFEHYVEHHLDQCTKTVRLYPGVREFLTARHAEGHPLAVVTNKPARFAAPIVQHLELEELLPVVVGGDTLPVRKPDPEPLRHALRELGRPTENLTAADVTMVGDGPQDLRAARALGARSIACLFGFTAPERLRDEGADEYWHAFGESAATGTA
ncbi:MAG: HAD-IA family hydrolase [bacterium]|nr:HAD-IA family hydrolase [bacterium]